MKKSAKPGLAEKYQLGIVGDYPTTIRPMQVMKLTFDVVSEVRMFSLPPSLPPSPPCLSGLVEKYQLGIVGDYPTTIRPMQVMKLTFDMSSLR